MKKILVVLLACLSLFTATVQAKDGGTLYVKLGTFTVNLQNIDEYVQAEITVKLAAPEILDAVKIYLPRIKHEIILLLSTQDSQQLATLAGKQKLIEQTKTMVNKALKLEPKDGVTDVLFESFVIQQ
ncbi:MAG: flagellar basal body-associated FliL family protein [Sulfuricellaceae bacterium]